MNNTYSKISLVIGLAVFLWSATIKAAIVNIDALTNTPSNPVTLFLAAGSYDVTPIGISDGGQYNAWDANITDAVPSWVNAYSISSDQFATFRTWDLVFYTSDLLALENANSASFTLTTPGNVNFFNADSFFPDNGAGMSLQISSVPIPSAVWLLLTGISALLGITRRQRN